MVNTSSVTNVVHIWNIMKEIQKWHTTHYTHSFVCMPAVLFVTMTFLLEKLN